MPFQLQDRANVTQVKLEDIAPKRRCMTHPPNKEADEPKRIPRQDPFVLQLKQKRVKKCQGCKGDFGEPVPPADLVIQHRNNFPYYNKKEGKRMDKWTNGYFHANVACIKPRFSDFDPREVVMPPATLKDLTEAHVDYCRQHGLVLALGFL
ncbi:uncharacterized protein LOC118418354 [Branchiostoma floridae]|uniref:Uncharacterized protein LOC118418354 n=1 Tax=Branchiostoma floridae TaxID=7739 RepID=A0A9J7LEJ2_BRAFL|nr:uncharacterized protein LOC118418354 [Branchiostoma floridae]